MWWILVHLFALASECVRVIVRAELTHHILPTLLSEIWFFKQKVNSILSISSLQPHFVIIIILMWRTREKKSKFIIYVWYFLLEMAKKVLSTIFNNWTRAYRMATFFLFFIYSQKEEAEKLVHDSISFWSFKCATSKYCAMSINRLQKNEEN